MMTYDDDEADYVLEARSTIRQMGMVLACLTKDDNAEVASLKDAYEWKGLKIAGGRVQEMDAVNEDLDFECQCKGSSPRFTTDIVFILRQGLPIPLSTTSSSTTQRKRLATLTCGLNVVGRFRLNLLKLLGMTSSRVVAW